MTLRFRLAESAFSGVMPDKAIELYPASFRLALS
jgi:hypothetical protein